MPNTSPSPGKPRALPRMVPWRLHHRGEQELVVLVSAARAGDPEAWTRLVQRFDRTLRHIAGGYRLSHADVDDVLQKTWLDLLGSIERIREPAAVGAWLATAARRNALRTIQIRAREKLTDDPTLGDCAQDNEPGEQLIALERRATLIRAIATLPDRHRRLLIVLLTHSALSYDEVGELLSIPRGSIGPIRARSLARLARDAQLRAVCSVSTQQQRSLRLEPAAA